MPTGIKYSTQLNTIQKNAALSRAFIELCLCSIYFASASRAIARCAISVR